MHTYPCGRLTATRLLGLSMISQRIEAGARAPVPAGDFQTRSAPVALCRQATILRVTE